MNEAGDRNFTPFKETSGLSHGDQGDQMGAFSLGQVNKMQRYGGEQYFYSASNQTSELTPQQERKTNQVKLTAEMINQELDSQQIKELVGKLKPDVAEQLLEELQAQEAIKKYIKALIEFIKYEPKETDESGEMSFGQLLKTFNKKFGFNQEGKDTFPWPYPREVKPTPQPDTEGTSETTDLKLNDEKPLLNHDGGSGSAAKVTAQSH
jgi:hypothetical protein